MKKHESRKLFYDKYLYKLEVRSSLATIFRNKNLVAARGVLDDLQNKLERNEPLVIKSYLRSETVLPKTLYEAQTIYSLLSQPVDYKLRIEKPVISIYSNDKDFLINFASKMQQESHFYEPETNVKNLLENNPNIIILKNQIPYEYRITLGNQKTYDFKDWLHNNPDKVKASSKLLQYLDSNRSVDGQILYARDDKIIQLLSLLNVTIRRIDKIVCEQNLDK